MRCRTAVVALVVTVGVGVGVAACNAVPPMVEPTIAPALACRGYQPEASSPYQLPYPPGAAYFVTQGNCSSGGHHPGRVFKYGYDFIMDIGTPVHAARAGVVIGTEARFRDANRTPWEENYVFVRHDDGTVARYFHLTLGGVRVATGDRVVAGDLVGLSGDTGESSRPHLHFDVVPFFCEARDCTTLPVTFHNTRPHPNGLVAGETYIAR
jgi:murein DD-endopeptidase MepM/ murein hydrolase activator NlpD